MRKTKEAASFAHPVQSLRTVGLFAGIGGVELGLQRHGHSTVFLAEIDATAQAVLRTRFPHTRLSGDVRAVGRLPACDLIAAGFPCQDLSQCGKARGIQGRNSSLVREVFRLIETTRQKPEWLLLENVPFMLHLDAGRAMTFLTGELERLGYRWAYRTVDARAFGLPQRRLRVLLLAARDSDPRTVLFADDAAELPSVATAESYGFYWTEGLNGLGWGVDCVPTLKGGSGIGIPSPPAIWIPGERCIVTIDVRDAERLQGFPVDWTKPAQRVDPRAGVRWRLIGNAVCVRVAAWIGRRLALPGSIRCDLAVVKRQSDRWPMAAYGNGEAVWRVAASTWPVAWQKRPLLEFLRFRRRPLSMRATAGFFSRAQKSQLTFPKNFLADLEYHLAAVSTL